MHLIPNYRLVWKVSSFPSQKYSTDNTEPVCGICLFVAKRKSKIIDLSKVNDFSKINYFQAHFLSGTNHNQETLSKSVYSHRKILLHNLQTWLQPKLSKKFQRQQINRMGLNLSIYSNSIENFWSLIKRDAYENGNQYSSKEYLSRAIKITASNVKVKSKKLKISERLW